MDKPTLAERVAWAEQLGVHEQYLYQFFEAKRDFAPGIAPDIERVTGGRFTVEQMCPDCAWVRVPDESWPNANGRPCRDTWTERATRAKETA